MQTTRYDSRRPALAADAREAAYKAGDLYVNVHSDAYKDGEIRGQIKP